MPLVSWSGSLAICDQPQVDLHSSKGSPVGLDHICHHTLELLYNLWVLRPLSLLNQLLEHVERYVANGAMEQEGRKLSQVSRVCKR